MFRLIAITLAATLCLPAAEVAKPDFHAIALEVPSGVRVRISTTDKKSLQGQITAVTSDGITLHVIKRGHVTWQSVQFSQMKSIKQISYRLTFWDVARFPLDLACYVGLITWYALAG